jgi:Na+-transporting methylmalonyl-CoA/oxaloacetate decarboxylase gamma subunit
MTTQLFQLLAAMTLGEKLLDAVTVTIVGMGTVFVSLWLIGEVFTLLHRFFERRERGSSDDPDAQLGKATQAAAASGIDAHLVPILIAAATAAVGRRIVLRRIRFINRNTVSGWAEAGRAAIQTSHNIRRKM